MAGWSSLPLELRWEILEVVAGVVAIGHDKNKLSTYASVAYDWQAFFEKITFRSLMITSDCVGDFEYVVSDSRGRNLRSRQDSIRHVWLHVKLPGYDCEVCSDEEDAQTSATNNVIFTNAMWHLLTVLASWDPKPDSEGLSLELSAQSTSDGEHWYKSYLMKKDYPHKANLDELISYLENPVFDLFFEEEPDHGPQNGERSEEAVKRLRNPLDFDFSDIHCRTGWTTHRLPRVGVVTQFITRRQFYRSICTTALSKLFSESLVGLRAFRCERWESLNPHDLEESRDHASFLEKHIPSSVRSFSILEDRDYLLRSWALYPNIRRGQGIALAKAVRSVQHAAVTFAADAEDFVDAFSQEDPADLTSAFWCHNLKTLSLATTIPGPRSRGASAKAKAEAQVGTLFEKAARAALFMPSLQILEIFNPAPRDAFAFRYEVPDGPGPCKLTWQTASKRLEPCGPLPYGLTRLILRPSAVREWENVADTNAKRDMVFEEGSLFDLFWSWGHMLDDLRLRNLMVHPTSLLQLCQENGGRLWSKLWGSVME